MPLFYDNSGSSRCLPPVLHCIINREFRVLFTDQELPAISASAPSLPLHFMKYKYARYLPSSLPALSEMPYAVPRHLHR